MLESVSLIVTIRFIFVWLSVYQTDSIKLINYQFIVQRFYSAYGSWRLTYIAYKYAYENPFYIYNGNALLLNDGHN